MTKKKKIEVLDRQILKLIDPYFNRSTWQLETGNLLIMMFDDGENKKDQLTILNQPGSAFADLDVEKLKTDWKNLLDGYKYEIELTSETSEVKTIELDTSKVFIVHGHDNEAKEKVARFISKLGFDPIILHEQASSSRTIIEKIEDYGAVGFAIILYTPCDIGKVNNNDIELTPRARQNVVFEHGYFIGRIGRPNVLALVKGDIETPNDISGVVYTKLDSDDAWHLRVAKELHAAGYNVDMSKLL